MLKEPLSPEAARRLIHAIRDAGGVTFSRHAVQEMEADRFNSPQVDTTLRSGLVAPAEYENGSWRYQVRAGRMAVVIAFRSELELVVVTVWRLK